MGSSLSGLRARALAGAGPGFSLGYSPVGVRKGDVVALKLCVDRLLPIRAARDRAVELVLRAAESAADLVAATAVVIERAAAGEIASSEAKEFMALFQSPSDRGGSAARGSSSRR
jgi:hypothetical protein